MADDDDDVKQADAADAAGGGDEAPAAAAEGDAAAAGEGDDAPAGEAGDDAAAAGDPDAVYDVPVEVTAVLGTATMKVSQLLKLGRGAVVQLDRMVGETIDLHANNRLIARGEVVVIDDRLGVTMTEIIKSDHS
ncbi:MAG: flagellar motor switch protein FliN [Proteobacteria bacterium]|nr:flagellar motor switch protein FliN [Pseudomonadota bacterium]